MTIVRMPVRIRLELDPAQPHGDLADLVRDATEQAAGRAADRARGVPAVRDATWDGGPPGMTVRFTGDPLPQWLATDLAAATSAGLQVATARLQAPPTPTKPSKAPAGSPAPVVLRLRSFRTMLEVAEAVLSHYDGTPPDEVLVVARNAKGTPFQAIMSVDGDTGRFDVRDLWPFKTLSPWSSSAAAGPGAALDADGLRYRRPAADAQQWHTALVELSLEDLRRSSRGGTSMDERELKRKATATAERYPWPGPVVIYEFLKGGAHVRWLVGPASLTNGTLPAAVFTEEVPRQRGGGSGSGKDCPPLDLSSADEANLDAPYLGEPHLDQWPEDHDSFARQIREIATRLEMPEGGYVGAFVIVATDQIGRQCQRLGSIGGGTRARQAELRRLAEVSVLVTNLAAAYVEAMYARDRAHTLPCPVAGHSGQWALHFRELFIEVRRNAVGQLFVSACQDVLLEVLETSLVELDRRLDLKNFPQYMRVTRALLVIVLSQSVELEDLRRRIGAAKARDDNPALAARVPNLFPGDWRRAGADAVAAIHDAATDNSPAGAVVFVDDKYWAKDAHGHWWSDEQLAFAIGTARDEAFLIDPFLAKIKDLSDVVSRLKNAQRRDDERSEHEGNAVTEAVDAEFAAVLKDVRRENLERTARVRRDRSIAIGLASFIEDRTDEIGARLTGIHRLADQRLRPMFAYQAVYVDALHALADTEQGKAELFEFFNLVGLPFLAVFCPPAAFLIGAGMAVSALATAYEHRGIQRAMLGGDEIITRAQAEAELWAAWIGAALTFLPEVKPGLRGLFGAAKRVLPGAERRAAAIAATRLAKDEAERLLAAATSEALVSAFLRETVKGYVLNLVLSSAIDRFIDAVVSEDPHGEISREDMRAIMTEATRVADAGRGTP